MMDKKQLQQILSTQFQPIFWRQVLTDIFGARNLHQQPQKIALPSNKLAENAFELGFFNTTDDRIIGLYQIDLKDNVKIERNKVGLRELLRKIYKYDVDGALVVFVQNEKWRLSFISEIRVLNEDGSIDKKATEPKRYTYLLGRGEKTKTATDRIFLLANKKIALEDIRSAFSVEALNNEFYKNIAEFFYELVGSTTKKGKKIEVREKRMKLPGVSDDDRQTYQEFAVRLIGRIVFCWFLKVKKTDAGEPLLPEKLLSSESVEKNKNYYHEILEPLFFKTLNTPMANRIEDLPDGCETVPFLNGGLFEPQPEDFYNAESKTGNYQNYGLKIPDDWFERFFATLEQYNFTIDENSPTEVEISVDPEMLGRIFENLLAEIDPDSGETARKATGSFYTPREIVNYMVDESLIIYLKSKLQTEPAGFQSLKTPQATFGGNDWREGQLHLEYSLNENRWQGKDKELEETLRRLFSYAEAENPFDEADTQKLIKAIDDLKILDPACGSGAFPMGVLHRLVFLLGKLDRKNERWKAAQIAKIDRLIKNANDIEDLNLRRKITDDLRQRKAEIEKDFENKEFDFGRKLFLIENCIYGVDIQPIAAEISKLRCFLTLIVDEDVSDDLRNNRGVKPLPNLEFKFVTADALLKLPEAEVQADLFNNDDNEQLAKLGQLRHDYIQSFGEQKKVIKEKFEDIQDDIRRKLNKYGSRENKRALALSNWNPFSHDKVDWFAPEWMFGVEAFDIVIGNPPYVQMQKDGGRLAKLYAKENYQTYERTGDIYCLFYERGYHLLKNKGVLCYITSNKWMRAGYGASIRNFFANNTNPIQLIDFAGQKIFEAATVDTNILLFSKDKNQQQTFSCVVKEKVLNNLSGYFRQNASKSSFNLNQSWVILSPIEQRIKEKIEAVGTPLKDWNINIYRGILTGYNEAFIIDGKKKDELIAEDPKSAEIIRPILRGRDIKRYRYEFADLYLIATFPSLKIDIDHYPAVKQHLLSFGYDRLKQTGEPGARKKTNNKWFETQDSISYWEDFYKQKIIWGNLNLMATYCIANSGIFINAPCSMIVPANQYLLAVLNSKLADYYIRNLGVTRNGGYFEYKPMFIERLPVPLNIDPELSKKIEDCCETIQEFARNSLNYQKINMRLNNIIYNLYGLTNEEIEFIESQ